MNILAINNKFIFIMLIVMATSGCAGFIWNETGWDGPIVENKTMARLVQKCGRSLFNYPFCKRAFVDKYGDHVDLVDDIRKVIDRFLIKIPAIASWVKVPQKHGSPRAKNDSIIPFRFHILTISPIVVLVVPQEPSESKRCVRPYDNGCMNTSRLKKEPYWYVSEPLVKTGSFWFNPDLSIGPIYIPEGAKKYNIKLDDSVIKLTSKNGVWDYQRNYFETTRN